MSEKIVWKRHFVELIVVTLGVLFAFALSNINEGRQEKKHAKSFLKSIEVELEENLAEIKKALPYHEELLRKLRESPMDANLVLRPAALNNVAWKMAQTPIFLENTNLSTYRELAKIYQYGDFIFEQAISAGEKMDDINILGPYYMLGATEQNLSLEKELKLRKKMKQSWIPIFETWVSIEAEYMKILQKYLNVDKNN